MAAKKLSGQKKVQKALESGKTLTPAQISKRYGLKNPHQQVYHMEHVLGITVHREYKLTKKGRTTVKYFL